MVIPRLILLSIFFLILFVTPFSSHAQIEKPNLEKEKILNQLNARLSSSTDKLKSLDEEKFDDLVHYGDLIDIDILGSFEYDWRGTITPEGFLTGANFVGNDIYAVCQKPESIAKQIAKSYGRFLRNPKVIVTILDRSKRAHSTIHGAVKKPMAFKMRRKVHLNELIILAGGFTDNASGRIQIIRQPNASCAVTFELEKEAGSEQKGKRQEFMKINTDKRLFSLNMADLLKGKKEANPQIFYGDVITVQKADPVYVMGNVEKPTMIYLRNELTVLRAIASAGGETKKADLGDITIFRREKGGTIVIKVNLDDVKKKKTPDFKLRAFDVVEVGGDEVNERKYPPIFRAKSIMSPKNSDFPVRVID